MIRFLHAADLHLDAPFSSLSPEQAALRRKEQRQMPQAICDAANAYGCELLLLAGDLFDADEASPETLEALARAFAGCRAEVFIAPGNHDCAASGSVYRTYRWPENVHIFLDEQIRCVELPKLHCRVWGAGFSSAYEKPLLEGFCARRDGMIELMVLHGDAMTSASDYNPISKEQIERSHLHYLALGHIHQASGLLRAGDTYYAWPGCAMGRGFDELGEKGAYLGSIDETGACTLEFLPLAARRYEILRVSAGDDARAAIEAALPHETQNDVYRIILTGESERIDVRALYAQLNTRFFGLTIRDETTPRTELWDGADGDTLRGLFLRTLKAQYDAAQSESERRIIALAARCGAASLDAKAVEL